MNCQRCGERLQALLTSLFCPNSCDKIEKGPYCPDCGSNNTEMFDVSGVLDCFSECETVRDLVTFHCWPCGHVWNVEPQKPETD